MATEPYRSSFTRSSTMWVIQRVTAAFLIIVLAFHFFQLHFIEHAWEITFAGTQARMESVTYFTTMVLFLLTATVHGVNGIYNALVNQGLSGRPRRVLKWVLAIASAVLIVQGIRVALVMAGFTSP